MGQTMIEKILGQHSGRSVVQPGEIVDVAIDVRIARDFGGANVVAHLERCQLPIADATRTFFTFDCNPGGSDQKYTTNQHKCRLFARARGIRVYDINQGIGTHLALDQGLIVPGETLVSTDSHANILGAIGAFGQGMGDQDIAHAFAFGRVWFKVPPTIKVILEGLPPADVTAKDVTLHLLRHFGARGLLGYAAEFYGPFVENLGVDGRMTMASMATEMGAIIALLPPNQAVQDYCRQVSGRDFPVILADEQAHYARVVEIDLTGVTPLVARPGKPEDVVPVEQVRHTKIDSALIGSCTNGRWDDLQTAAAILKDRRVAPGVVLKIIPSTDALWRRCLDQGLLHIFKQAGALVGNSGCAGCAAGQIGQNGPGEVTISTGNRNFPGKQGRGAVYLASPATVAASAVAGVITTREQIPAEPVSFSSGTAQSKGSAICVATSGTPSNKPVKIRGRIWVIARDNIDTDMIFHNRHLAVTELAQMGQYAFGNLPGWEDFATKARAGDIIVTGANFGCGSSRQQAVDCFRSLGIALIIAASFGAIYERNAINAGLPIMNAELLKYDLQDGEELEVDFTTGRIVRLTNDEVLQGVPFSPTQLQIYQRGGLLVMPANSCNR